MAIQVDRDFPGGNILVDGIEGQTIHVRQDWSTSREWWFYWALRVTGAAGQTLRFDFGKEAPFTATGPCLSLDGTNWVSLGRACVSGHEFSITLPPTAEVAYLAMCVPYVLSNLETFLRDRPGIKREVLCRDRSGAAVPLITLPAREPKYQVLLTARHHACESLASFALEGIYDYALQSREPTAEFLRQQVTIRAVPLVDFDGVQAGDQGKFRQPHDHDEDYTAQPLYPTIAALQQLMLGRERGGKVDAFLDLHCPYIWFGRNEEIFIVGMPQPAQIEVDKFRAILAETQTGELPYDPAQDCPWGVEWNKDYTGDAGGFAWKAAQIPLAAAFELPYGLAGGKVVTAEGMRQLGHDIGRSLGKYLAAHGR